MSDIANSWMAEEIFKLLTGQGHEIFMYDNKGKRVYNADQSTFLYSDPAKLMVTLGYTKGKPAKPLVKFYCSQTTPMKLTTQMKSTLKQHNLYDHSFDTYIYGKTLQPKHFVHHVNPSEVTESSWTGSTRTSRMNIGETQVVIRHSHQLDDSENTPRWTRIKDIFIHAPDGSRYRCPWKHITGARALAQHIEQGNGPWDNQGEMIHHLIRTLMQMRKVRKWLQTNGDETTQSQAETLAQGIKTLLRRIAQSHSYATGIDQASDHVNSWKAAAGEPTMLNWPDGAEDAAAAMNSVINVEPDVEVEPESMPAYSWDDDIIQPQWFREQKVMENWFRQFDSDVIFEKDADVLRDVEAASEDAESEDPREVYLNLKDNVPNWEASFEQDPKSTLDGINSALEKLKKIR